jgi:hypothetical protein
MKLETKRLKDLGDGTLTTGAATPSSCLDGPENLYEENKFASNFSSLISQVF